MECYPHGEDSYQNRDKLNKDCVAAKLKSVRASYRRAVKADKCSEGSRICSHFSVFVKKFGDALLL